MKLQTLSYGTEALFARFDGSVREHDSHVVLATPKNPAFVWGNMLVFSRPPTPRDLDPREKGNWMELAAQELPGVPHCLLGWEEITGAAGAARTHTPQGFSVDDGVTLMATSVHPPRHHNEALQVRAIASDADFRSVSDVLLAAFTRRAPNRALHEAFVRDQVSRYRNMVANGMGTWFGAFLGVEMVGTLGIFVFEGLGRYQMVGTLPTHRGQGVCGTLVFEAGKHALASMGAQKLVLCADASYHAARIYESVGFHAHERVVALLRPGA